MVLNDSKSPMTSLLDLSLGSEMLRSKRLGKSESMTTKFDETAEKKQKNAVLFPRLLLLLLQLLLLSKVMSSSFANLAVRR